MTQLANGSSHTERRTAELAAAGLSNREIGAQFFLAAVGDHAVG